MGGMKKSVYLSICFKVANVNFCNCTPKCFMLFNQQDDAPKIPVFQFQDESSFLKILDYTGKSGESTLSMFVNDSCRYESIPISFHANYHCFY